MTVRGYVRVSSPDQVDNYSLAGQRAKIEAWAAYQNLTDVDIYEDAGISGTRDDRPGLTALLLDLKPGDTVVTYALSRLARGGAVQLLGIVRDIRAKDARVVFLQENIDTETSTGRLMLTILAALAELELEQMRERTEMGRTQAAQEGIFPHSARALPLGWTKDDEGRVVENPQEADIVRLIFQQGQAPYHATARMLNEQGIPTQRGGVWKVPQVRRAVQFDGYATGQLIYRAHASPDEPERHVMIPAPKLIDEGTWAAAQRDASTNHRSRKPDVFPLTGHLRCACGTRMVGRVRVPAKAHWQTRALYVCPPNVRHDRLCPVFQQVIPEAVSDTLHPQARQLLADLLTSPHDPAHIAAAYGAAPTLHDHSAPERAEIQRKLDNLVDLFLESLIDRPAYQQRHATLKARLESLAPPAQPRPQAMPPQPQLARAALNATNEEFAELLQLLELEYTLTSRTTLEITSYTPLKP